MADIVHDQQQRIAIESERLASLTSFSYVMEFLTNLAGQHFAAALDAKELEAYGLDEESELKAMLAAVEVEGNC
jgi:hypothetical protein